MDIKQWYIHTFPKPQFNWYNKNDTYFEDINNWNINLENLLYIFY